MGAIVIKVKFVGPDDAGRGARYRATGLGRHATVEYDYAGGPEKSARDAAEKLIKATGLAFKLEVLNPLDGPNGERTHRFEVTNG